MKVAKRHPYEKHYRRRKLMGLAAKSLYALKFAPYKPIRLGFADEKIKIKPMTGAPWIGQELVSAITFIQIR